MAGRISKLDAVAFFQHYSLFKQVHVQVRPLIYLFFHPFNTLGFMDQCSCCAVWCLRMLYIVMDSLVARFACLKVVCIC